MKNIRKLSYVVVLALTSYFIFSNRLSAETLFKSSVVGTDIDFIERDDKTASSYHCYLGRFTLEMPDRRNNTLMDANAEKFSIHYDDGTEVEIWGHSDFGGRDDVEKYVIILADPIGKLPKYMRQQLFHVVVHKGNEAAFAESHGGFFVMYSDNIAFRFSENDLEETVFHESVHATLDRDHIESEDWSLAQKMDRNFVTQYGAKVPHKEDLAETALFAHTMIKHPGRLPAETEKWLQVNIPNRLAYLQSVFNDFQNIPVKVLPLI